MGISKSMVFRMLTTLEYHGFVSRDPDTGRFRLGYSLLGLAELVGGTDDLRRMAHHIMAEVAVQSRETCLLTVADGAEAICIHKIDSPDRIRVTHQVGHRSPMHAGASSKVLLAHLPEDEREAILALPRKRYTENTTVDVEVLREQLATIRKQGYCFTISELDVGLFGVAAPIRNHRGRVVAGLNVSGVAQKLTPEKIEEHITAVRAAAAKISHMIGWRQ